jgi:hypothetical protein
MLATREQLDGTPGLTMQVLVMAHFELFGSWSQRFNIWQPDRCHESS